MEGTGDEYSNTSTGYRVSAMDRKESFTDENYGETASKTRKDIERGLKDDEQSNNN